MLSGSSEPTIGDGIVSLAYAHLDGAKQLTLPNVYHSINSPGDYWYGGEAVVDQWLPIVQALSQRRRFSDGLSKLSQRIRFTQ